MNATRRPFGRAVLLFGLFVALQTFLALSESDRWGVLLYLTRETWLLVVLLWAKNLVLAAAGGLLAGWVLRRTLEILQDEAGRDGLLQPGAAETALVLLITAAVVPLRWIAADVVPPGLWVDILYETRPVLLEPERVLWAGVTPLVTGGETHEVISNAWLVYARAVYGLFGRTDLGFLAISAIPGCLVPPAVWWLARELYGRRVALLALALAGVASWPLVVARWGHAASLTVPLVLVAMAATLSALRTGRTAWAALAGLAEGLSLHLHTSAWAVAPMFALFTLGGLRRKGLRKLVLVGWLLAALAAAPFVAPFLADPSLLGGHARDVHLGKPVPDVSVPRAGGLLALPAALAYNTIRYSGLFLFTQDPNPRHSVPGRGPVLPLFGAAALVGAACTIVRAVRGDPRETLLLLVSAGMLAAGILSDPGGAPNTHRTSALLGPMLVWIAVTLVRWSDRWDAAGKVRRRVLLPAAVTLALTAETVPLFTAWPFDPRVEKAFSQGDTEAGRILRRLGEGARAVGPGAVRNIIVLEALSGPAAASAAMQEIPLLSPPDLVAVPPDSGLWYVCRRESLDDLRGAGWRCARGIPPDGSTPEVVVAFGRPPRPL